ncbi:MAG TPA: carboxypeptidase regulatory-like domain-containing protein [Polyangiaceae bacterium]|nr:carboxypeptidase regulatory-like domain-containing protein [Polyangiaceae bacterium]
MKISKRHWSGAVAGGSLLIVSGIAASGSMARAAGTITISGFVTDSSGNPIEPPVSIAINGSAQKETLSDPSTGAYSFTVAPGSYSISASMECLAFDPNVVNLNNITTNQTVDFIGSGNNLILNCEPPSSSGGTSGSLTIHGTVTSAGNPVAGAKVSLNGSSQGFRYADETGSYSFLVNPGSYSVGVSEGCNSYSPSVDNLNNLKTSQTVNFTGSGNCPPAPLQLCPTLDSDFDLAALGDVCQADITTNTCADRLGVWDFAIEFSDSAVIGTDCRFGQLQNIFTFNEINDYIVQVELFIVYLMGCPYVGTQIGPLTDGLVPADLLAAGFKFTTADVAALTQDFLSATEGTLSANGTPLTSAQITALTTQLTYLGANVPNLVNSSSLSYSTCGDGGAP